MYSLRLLSTKSGHVQAGGGNGSRGKRGRFRRSEEWRCTKRGPSSGAPFRHAPGSQGGEVESYVGGNPEEKDEA